METFSEHLDDLLAREKVSRGELVRGTLMVNAFDPSRAYLRLRDQQFEVIGMAHRNRALHGDIVAAQLMGGHQASVRSILRPAQRRFVCRVKSLSADAAVLVPVRIEYPTFKVPPQDVDAEMFYVVEMKEWAAKDEHPDATVVGKIGKEELLKEPEMGTFSSFNVNFDETFPAEVVEEVRMLNLDPAWEPKPKDFPTRTDLTDLCIFTIDSATSSDLDNAYSVRGLVDEGFFEVGFHVADVSHFVQFGGPMDMEAVFRSSSVFSPRTSPIPMIPPILSENLCSLHPGKNRLAISMFCTFDTISGAVVDRPRICRSIIRSSARFDFDVVDEILAADDPSKLSDRSMEYAGKFLSRKEGLKELKESMESLFSIADLNRRKRIPLFQRIQVDFQFDDEKKNIKCVNFWHNLKSSTIVEEMSLIANVQIASIVLRIAPEFALLRIQEGPTESNLRTFAKWCQEFGFTMDVSSKEKIAMSFHNLLDEGRGDEVSLIAQQFLSILGHARTQTSGTMSEGQSQEHYMMNGPYMQWTAPLRRYTDLLAHRVLVHFEIEKQRKRPPFEVDELQEQCEWCMYRMTNHRTAQRLVEGYYMGEYLARGETIFDGVIRSFGSRRMGIFFPFLDALKSVGFRKLRTPWIEWKLEKPNELTLCGPSPRREDEFFTLRLFDVIKCRFRMEASAFLPQLEIHEIILPIPKEMSDSKGKDALADGDTNDAKSGMALTVLPDQLDKLEGEERVFMTGIPAQATSKDVFRFFWNRKGLVRVDVCEDRSGLSRGFAFLTFANLELAQSFVDTVHQKIGMAGGESVLSARIAQDFHRDDRAPEVSMKFVAAASVLPREKRSALSTGKSRFGPHGSSVFVRQISPMAFEEEVLNLFRPFGTIISSRVSLDRGFAVISFENSISANIAISMLHNYSLHGQRLVVHIDLQSP